MTVRLTECLAVVVLAAVLAVGPAAHRVWHASEYARTSDDAAPQGSRSQQHSLSLLRAAPTGSFEESICVLCQVPDGQLVPVQHERSIAAPTLGVVADNEFLIRVAPLVGPPGRAPPSIV